MEEKPFSGSSVNDERKLIVPVRKRNGRGGVILHPASPSQKKCASSARTSRYFSCEILRHDQHISHCAQSCRPSPRLLR